MTTDQKVIKNKLGVLRLAEMLGNVSEASGGPRLLDSSSWFLSSSTGS